jgi:hypothetical protein
MIRCKATVVFSKSAITRCFVEGGVATTMVARVDRGGVVVDAEYLQGFLN